MIIFLAITNYNYTILTGLMKRKFPNVNSGNLGVEVGELVRKFYTGIQYYAIRDEHQLNYGSIDTCVGKVWCFNLIIQIIVFFILTKMFQLNMNEKHLEENLDALLKDINSIRPKRDGAFITR